jgi:DNA-binding transcriptional LysR family regulator
MAKLTQLNSKLHQASRINTSISWDSIRVFLKVANCGSFRAVAVETGIACNTIRRMIEGLEREAGALMFERSARGVKLTSEGARVFEASKAMLEQAEAVNRVVLKKAIGARSTVRVGITEGLGAFWLVPRMMDLFRERPGIQVDLRCSMTMPNLNTHEVDIAVQLDRPIGNDLVITRLGWLHVVLFASKGYIKRAGKLESKADLNKHQIIEFVAPQVSVDSLRQDMTEQMKSSNVGLRVNTSSAQVLAATHGAGITALPTYAPLVTNNLIQLAPDWHLTRDIWLAYHPKAAELPHIRQTIAWIRRAFDNQACPWFAEKFMSPSAIEEHMQKLGLVQTFATFKD